MISTGLRSIMVASDLSDGAAAALRAAATLAERTGAKVHAVHAFELPQSPLSGAYWSDGAPVPDVHLLQHLLGEMEEALNAQVAAAVPPAVRGTSAVMLGSAPRALLDRAAGVEADLIVLGPHRRRAVGEGLLGSTADRLLRTSAVPCLVVPGEMALPLHHVVVPFDLSDPGRAAVDTAIAWGAAFGRRDGITGLPGVGLKVVHVLPGALVRAGLPFDHATVGPALHRDVEAAVARVCGSCGVDVTEEIVFGDETADALVDYARRGHADLVVMGTHGYGAVKRALIGSVASGVARRAPCAVLLIPPALLGGDAETTHAAAMATA